MLRNQDSDKTLTQQLVPIAVVLVTAGAVALEAPRQWEHYQQRQSEVTHVASLQRSNELMEQERAIANARYEAGCLMLSENGYLAQLVSNSKVVSGINGNPLQPGLVVCDAIGGTAIVGEEGQITQFAGNGAPDVVRKAIERATASGVPFGQIGGEG